MTKTVTTETITITIGDWVRVSRRTGGPGLDTGQVVKFAVFGGQQCAEIDGLAADGTRWLPVHRITAVVD